MWTAPLPILVVDVVVAVVGQEGRRAHGRHLPFEVVARFPIRLRLGPRGDGALERRVRGFVLGGATEEEGRAYEPGEEAPEPAAGRLGLLDRLDRLRLVASTPDAIG